MSRPVAHPTQPTTFIGALVAALVLALLVPGQGARADVSDTITVVKEGEQLDNAEIVARLAEATFDGPTTRVLIGREDLFADNIASAVMQDDAPLLLVPSAGPVTERVTTLLDRYDPDEVVLLGGEAAIGAEVEQALSADYTVTRRSGSTRFETAIDIAEKEAPTSDTAILARGFASEGATDGSQAFADALAAGGWAADNGWPILLTLTESLPGTVESYLMQSSIRNVMIMGGTAAVSADVETRLDDMGISTMRIAGPDRFSTAIEVARERGVDNATEAGRVVLVEGQSADAWAGGFAAASHSAVFDAPIVLVNGDGIPASTSGFLTPPAAFAGTTSGIVLTCAAAPGTCEAGRRLRGLPPEATVSFNPVSGSTVDGGSPIQVTVEYDGDLPHEVTGDCIPDTNGTAPGTASIIVDPAFEGECVVTSLLTLPSGALQTDSASYTVEPSSGGILTSAANLEQYTYVPGATEELVLIGPDDTFTIDGEPASGQVWFQQATLGDLVIPTAAFAGTAAPVNHALVNRDEAFYTSGTVGDVDTGAGRAAIIEPVSGYALRSFLFSGGLFTVDGNAATLATFAHDINEGDQISLGEDMAQNPTLDLTNDTISGPVTNFLDAGELLFQIDSGGLPDSPLIGDEPSGDADVQFLLFDDPAFDLLVNGEDATFVEFRDAINDGDMIAYSREGDVQRFALTDGAAQGISGLATETFEFFVGPSLTILEGSGRMTYAIEAMADYVMDGVLTTSNEFRSNYTPGDGVQITPSTDTTDQRIALSNQPLSGSLADIQPGTGARYDVVRTSGIVHDNLGYQGNIFGNGRGNRYFVDGTEVTVMDFETALNGVDTDVATIEVRPAEEAGAGIDNEHRLTTGS